MTSENYPVSGDAENNQSFLRDDEARLAMEGIMENHRRIPKAVTLPVGKLELVEARPEHNQDVADAVRRARESSEAAITQTESSLTPKTAEGLVDGWRSMMEGEVSATPGLAEKLDYDAEIIRYLDLGFDEESARALADPNLGNHGEHSYNPETDVLDVELSKELGVDVYRPKTSE